MSVITSTIDSRDGVFIGGKHLHNTFKPMTNTELTLDQLTAIAGGSLWTESSTGVRHIQKDIKDIFGAGKSIVHPQYRVAGSADPGGDDI